MTGGLTRKILKANMVIITAMLISSIFCVYVLTANLRINDRIQQVTLPSLEHLKNAKALMIDVKELTNTWTYIPNKIDQKKLLRILDSEYPKIDSSLQFSAKKSNDVSEEETFAKLMRGNRQVIDSVRALTRLLNSPVSYINDSLTNRATDVWQYVDKAVDKNDKLCEDLIRAKEARLLLLQQKMTRLLNILYVAILFSSLIVIGVTIVSYRYSQNKIIKPILDLNRSIQKMPVGEVIVAGELKKNDEIGEMYDAVNQMINSIVQKINFAEQIGKGNYDANFELLSDSDKLGTALLSMRDDLKKSNIELNASYNIAREQNNRLLNFSYIVSHNLRMHAVNIHGFLGLYDDATSEEEKMELINYMRLASEQLNDTMYHLNEVVAMQRSMKLKLEPIRLHDAIDHAISLLMPNIIDKKAVVRNEVNENVIVNYNAVYMDSILLNFLSNAIKYSRPDIQPEIVLRCYENNAQQRILEVADNGLGIDLAANKDKLYGMYKTFHGNKDAKGIGLFMTKYQVEAMGGNIEVDSIVGSGTTFKVLIK